MARVRVFMDTNVILEAFRTGCWPAIADHYAVETVERCLEETLTGDPADPRRIHVQASALNGGLAACHTVARRDIAMLIADHPRCLTLDAGEQHLCAYLYAHRLLPSTAIVVATADKAALIATHRLGWLDCAISLEELARTAGVARQPLESLRQQHRAVWLDQIKTRIRLGVMP